MSKPLKYDLIFVSSGKGGVGKTTWASAFADFLYLNNIDFQIVQIDDQSGLSNQFDNQVTTIEIVKLTDTRDNPNSLIHVFDPLYDEIFSDKRGRSPLIIDVGATQQHALLKYAALTDLDSELCEQSRRCLWIAPATSDPESMRQAASTLKTASEILPSLSQYVCLNLRDGPFEFYPSSPAEHIWRTQLEPQCTKNGRLLMPAIQAGSWQPFESTEKRFAEIAATAIPDIQKMTGLSRPFAKVLRGDIAYWLAEMFEEFERLLLPDTEDANNDN